MRIGVTAVMLPEIDFDEQVALCASLGVGFYQYRPRAIPEAERGKPPSPWGNHRFDLTPERLLREGDRLTARLREAGIEPWGTVPSASTAHSDEALRLHVEGAARAEAGRLRIAPPPYPDRPFDLDDYLRRLIERYAEIVERLTRPAGLKVLIETHCLSIAACPGLAWTICRPFAPRDLGVIWDVQNYTREGALAPILAVSTLRDWIDCVHMGGGRRLEGDRDRFGCRTERFESCPLEDSDLPAPRWLAVLREAGIDPPIIVEDFGAYADGPGRLERCVAVLRRISEGKHEA